MHEFGLAKTILNSVIKKAEEYNARRVSRIELRIGSLRMVTPISLQEAFNMVSSGTIASQARLDIKETPGEEVTIMNIEIE